jgi:hypothetical protein
MKLESSPVYYSHGEPYDNVTARLLLRPEMDGGVFVGKSRGWGISGENLLIVGVTEDEAKNAEQGEFSAVYDTIQELDEYKQYRLKKRSYIAEKIAHSLRHLRLHPLDDPMVSEFISKTNGHIPSKLLTGHGIR